MTKILFINIPAQGHINPTLPIVAELVRRDVEVVYVNTEATRGQMPDGVRFIAYPGGEVLEKTNAMAASGNLGKSARALLMLCEALLPWMVDVVGWEKPDLVVFDSLASWGKVAAQKVGVRSIASISTFVVNAKAMGKIPAKQLFALMRDFLPLFVLYPVVRLRMQRNMGIAPSPSMLMNTGARNLVYTSREFQPIGETFGNEFVFIGASVGERREDSDFPFEQLTGAPLIYISLGTINNQQTTFYRQCFEVFGGRSEQVVLSVGRNTAVSMLGTIPPNFIVRNFVPQLAILERASLFITHGGLNSAHEALLYGVPMLVVPQQSEQAIVARRVVEAGAGVGAGMTPSYGQTTADELRAAVTTLSADLPRYADAARRMGDTLRAAGGATRAADVLIEAAKAGEASKTV